MLHIFKLHDRSLKVLDSSKKLITTLNAHSYNTLQKDDTFREALLASDILLPDGVSMVWATRVLSGKRIKKIAGDDLFNYEMNRIQDTGGKCFFLGSTEETLRLITEKASREFPSIRTYSYSPPYKAEFSDEDNRKMIEAVNSVNPDVLFIGMTAPKQEKWAFLNFDQLNAGHICCIGAVFDFYAGSVRRAPRWMISIGLEWLYRLMKEPRRMWKRYVIGNPLFVKNVLSMKLQSSREMKLKYNLSDKEDFIKNEA